MIIFNLIDGATARQTAAGKEVDIGALITGLSGPPNVRLVNALDAPGVPPYSAQLPGVGGLFLAEKRITAITGSQANMILVYRAMSEAEKNGDLAGAITGIEISSTTTQETTDLDSDGEHLINDYRGHPDGQSWDFKIARETVNAEILRPQLVVRINQNLAAIPKTVAANFIGSVNADPWSGFPAFSWLCTSINAHEVSGLWRVVYEFMYRRETWRTRSIIRVNGLIPLDVAEGNGILTAFLYPLESYRAIGVSW